MNNNKFNYVRLPLEGIENCRELGGYGTKSGEQVSWHTFLRSSDMHELTESDASFLEEYGVKTIIDLRGEDEVLTRPNPLSKRESFHYYHIPFASQPLLEDSFSMEGDMGDHYVKMLEKSDSLVPIFNTIGLADEGAVLFHCAAGKDRTGLLAMLLLGLLGVERKDIIANYEVTYTAMESFQYLELPKDFPFEIPKELLYSKRDYIIKAYQHIEENYETFEKYLLAKDVEENIIHRVIARGTGKLIAHK